MRRIHQRGDLPSSENYIVSFIHSASLSAPCNLSLTLMPVIQRPASQPAIRRLAWLAVALAGSRSRSAGGPAALIVQLPLVMNERGHLLLLLLLGSNVSC